jgi:hypothetical protein
MAKQRKHLGEILYCNKLVDKDGLVRPSRRPRRRTNAGEALVSGDVDRRPGHASPAQQFGMEYIDLDKVQISATP